MTTLKRYKSYAFVNQDPVVKEIKWIMNTESISVTQAARDSGVSRSTIDKWIKGKTRRPQHASVMAVIRGAEYDMTITKRGKNDK